MFQQLRKTFEKSVLSIQVDNDEKFYFELNNLATSDRDEIRVGMKV